MVKRFLAVVGLMVAVGFGNVNATAQDAGTDTSAGQEQQEQRQEHQNQDQGTPPAGEDTTTEGEKPLIEVKTGPEDGAQGFSAMVNEQIAPVTDFISAIVFFEIPLNWLVEDAPGMPVIVIWLIGFATYFTFYMGFPQLRGIKQSWHIVRGKYDDPDDPGEVTHFQALTAALSGTVGLGNIAGVALAISIGGPGATFWMILSGLFGMASKFTECTLGLHYRHIDADGVVSGGPMHYLKDGLAKLGHHTLGKVLAVTFAAMAMGGAIGAGNMFQVNQASSIFTGAAVRLTGGESSIFFGNEWIFGLIFAFFVGLVIIGGIRKITHVTEFLVPIMAIIYVSSALFILISLAGEIPNAIALILEGAFTGEGIQGGIVGVLIMGLRRAAFSNEAGLGSAAIAHAAAKTREPIAEGLVALLEPFVDTVLVCTMTALVIIVTGFHVQTGTTDGIVLTTSAFDHVIDGFSYVLTIAAVLFAFSTCITWFYYGQRAFLFLVGNKPRVELGFKVFFLALLPIGATMNLTSVMDFADAMILGMGFPNLVGVFLLRKEVKTMLKSYLARVKSGEISHYIKKRAH
ncbi:alanine/glycine:cation symporter family protein [Yunchengibacter salinarum]|uniref:alanine/glycine:cation symporter family protein n=1 Tax=Yunchengibacter salinarum TaxID=3133399 RepID=UPI0035B656B1